MVVIYGTRFYGKVRACGSSYVATRFAHVYWLPLVPTGSHLVLEGDGDDAFRGITTPLDGKSVIAGYLRVWGPVAVALAVFIGLGAVSDFEDDALAMALVGGFSAVVVLALLGVTVLAYAVLGKLSLEERRKRSVYALHTGYFVDPGDMGDARPALRESLMAKIVERARGLAGMGYRMSADPVQAWPHIALDPTVNDDVLLTAAFTLARLEASAGQGPWKHQMEMLETQLWQRIVRTNAPYLEAHAHVQAA